jgi:hypothetical protein
MLFFFVIGEVVSFSLYFSGFYSQFNIPNILSSAIVGFLILIFLIKSSGFSNKGDKSLLCILLSLLFWITAEFLYGYYSGFLNIDAYPSVADLFYLAGYIFFVLFLTLMNKTYKIELAFILSLIVTFSLFVFYILYVEIFIFGLSDFGGSTYDLILLFTYPILDLFIAIGAVVYYFRGISISLNKEHTYWIFVSLFGFFFFVADLAFGYNDIYSITNTNYNFDLYYNIGYLLLGTAIIIRINYIHSPKKVIN